MLTTVKNELQRATPESQGIRSSAILKFVEAVESQVHDRREELARIFQRQLSTDGDHTRIFDYRPGQILLSHRGADTVRTDQHIALLR